MCDNGNHTELVLDEFWEKSHLSALKKRMFEHAEKSQNFSHLIIVLGFGSHFQEERYDHFLSYITDSVKEIRLNADERGGAFAKIGLVWHNIPKNLKYNTHLAELNYEADVWYNSI